MIFGHLNLSSFKLNILLQSTLIAMLAFVLVSLITALNVNAQTIDKKLDHAEVASAWKGANWEFANDWTPVTDEAKITAWGEAFGNAFLSQDLNEIQQYVAFDSLFDRCLVGISSEKFKVGFGSGIRDTAGNLLLQLSANQASYTFRGVRNTEFGPCALMRMLDPWGGCNYHLWRLQKTEGGDLKGVDLYVFLSGESFGDTMRRITLSSVPKSDNSFFDRLTGREQTIAEHQGEMMDMLRSNQEQDFKAVLESYAKLPDSLKNDKTFLVMRMSAALQVNEAEYRAALEDCQKLFPDDASAALLGLNFFYMKKQFPKLYAALNQLEAAVGDDGHLKMLRAVGLKDEGKLNEAKKAIEQAIKIEPNLENPHWTMIEIMSQQKDFAGVTSELIAISKQFGYTEFAIAKNPTYAEYIKTDEHAKFQEYLKTLKK